MAAPYLRMTVAVFVILSVAKESCPFVILRRKPKNPTKGKSGLRSWDASHSFSMTVRTIGKGNNYDKKA